MKIVPRSKFGKDHWSTLAYVETRAVDHGGVIDPRHMRDKTTRLWRPEYATILFDGKKQAGHDDWDCVKDLEAAFLLRQADGKLSLTRDGWKVVSELRQFRAEGGSWAKFEDGR